MENKDLDNFFKERAPQFDEQPGDALWAKIESGLDSTANTPATKQGGKSGFSGGKWLLLIGWILSIVILAMLLFPTESGVKVKLPTIEIQQEIVTETVPMPSDTVKPKNSSVAGPKTKKPVAGKVHKETVSPDIYTDTITEELEVNTPQPITPIKPPLKKIKISVQESPKRTVLTIREKVSQQKFDSIVAASLTQYKDKAGMQLIVKGFDGMIYRSTVPHKGYVQLLHDTIKTPSKNKLAVTAKLITTKDSIITESAEFTPRYDSVTDTYYVQFDDRDKGINEPVYTAQLTVQPEFPGGVAGFHSVINDNFEYPVSAKKTTAKIRVSFIIETDGSISNIKVLKDPGYGLGDEAMRVLKLLNTKWKPGEVKNKVVRTAYFTTLTVYRKL